MEALFREAVEKILPFTESKKLQKIPKLTPMVKRQRFPNRESSRGAKGLYFRLNRGLSRMTRIARIYDGFCVAISLVRDGRHLCRNASHQKIKPQRGERCIETRNVLASY